MALSVGGVLAITPQQVDRGELAYAQHCAFCHGPSGDDGFAPPLTGSGSLSSFATVRQFYDFVSTAMPQNLSGLLPMQTYLDVVAFELAQRGVATDGSELSLATMDTTRLNPAPSIPAPTARRIVITSSDFSAPDPQLAHNIPDLQVTLDGRPSPADSAATTPPRVGSRAGVLPPRKCWKSVTTSSRSTISEVSWTASRVTGFGAWKGAWLGISLVGAWAACHRSAFPRPRRVR